MHFSLSDQLGHFCLALHVAMQTGLYLHPYRFQSDDSGARRVVSEGSTIPDDFPADCPHRVPCGIPDTRRSQHIAELFYEEPN
jgi:hypothetical protein